MDSNKKVSVQPIKLGPSVHQTDDSNTDFHSIPHKEKKQQEAEEGNIWTHVEN